MQRPFKYWRSNRRFSGFSLGQLIGVYALGFALRHGAAPDDLQRALASAFRHRTEHERGIMLDAAKSQGGFYLREH